MSKFCHGCQTVKDASEFNKNRSKPDGLSSRCRQCNSAWSKKRQAEHPEVERARHQKWLKAHPDYPREASRRYRAAHPDFARTVAKRYRQRHPDRVKETRRRWNNNNRERLNLRLRMRHALKRSHGEFYTADEWRDLCAKYDNRCLACNQALPLTADHVVPVALGGPNTIDNIQPLCQPCNTRKGIQVIDYRPQADAHA